MFTRKLISPLASSEILLFCHLVELVNWEKREPQEVEWALNHSLLVVATFDDTGDMIGAGRVVGDRFSATLFDLIVDPKYQRHGIGKMLLGAITLELQRLGITKLYCLTDNDASAQYYRHRGWSELSGFLLDLQ